MRLLVALVGYFIGMGLTALAMIGAHEIGVQFNEISARACLLILPVLFAYFVGYCYENLSRS